MLKGLLVLGNMLGILFLNLFLADVSVTQSLPNSMEAGKEYTIEIKINKGDLTGFAQIKINIPEGMTASADNQNGASFTFKLLIIFFFIINLRIKL